MNHFVHHVPCYTMTIQRIHYWPAGSLLWLILRIVSVTKTLHNHVFSGFRRAVKGAPSTAARRLVHRYCGQEFIHTFWIHVQSTPFMQHFTNTCSYCLWTWWQPRSIKYNILHWHDCNNYNINQSIYKWFTNYVDLDLEAKHSCTFDTCMIYFFLNFNKLLL